MMDLLKTLCIHFGQENIKQLEKFAGVFLCEKKTPANKTYQIIFIDTTDNWCKENYISYLENVVIDKYYQSEGFLQWNFYFYIIATQEIIKANYLRKLKIENDETYTRKLVLTEDEFSDWVNSFKSIGDISTNAISIDLYTKWVNILRDKKLYFVFNSEKYPNYKQPVEDYINGVLFEDVEETDIVTSSNANEPILNRINRIELKAFREYPLNRDFYLGSVNLIHGANAVGKTSFFDAIELIVTGKLLNRATVNNYKIQLTTDSNTTLKFPTQPSTYKKRDIDWYSSGANRGNELSEHFNKFNYYTSEAAFQLKQDDTKLQNNLQKIITDIALGREVNKLEERINAFSEYFSKSKELLLSDLSKLNDTLQKRNEAIINLRNQQINPQGYKQELVESLKSNFWKTTLGDSNDSIAKLHNKIRAVNNILSNIQSKNIGFEKLSLAKVHIELKELNLKRISISTLKNEILKSQQKRQACINELEQNKSILPNIDELSLYFKHDQITSLVGLDKNIHQKNVELNRIKEIKLLSDSIFSNDFLNMDSGKSKTTKQLEDEFKAKEEILINNYSETKIRIKQIESGIKELSKIINDISSSGRIYLKLNPNAENCPLCNTHFSNNELVSAIQKTKNGFYNSKVLISLKEELGSTSSKIEEVKNQGKIISRLKKLALLLFGIDGYEIPYIEIKNRSADNNKNFETITESLLQLNILQSQFNNLGLTEDKYDYLRNRINDYFSLKIHSEAELNLQKQNLLNEQSKLSALIVQLEKEIISKQNALYDIYSGAVENDEQLSKIINTYQEVENEFEQLKMYLNFPSDTLLINIIARTNATLSAFENYKNAILELNQNEDVVTIIKKEISKLITEIDVLKPKLNRAKFAAEELNKLLLEQSKKDFLSEYIIKNKTEIVSIFKLIHTPKEFKDINFEDGKIILISIDNRERSLSEISTGQMSALALSIFLSLNKKLTKGPNILMFDDPVTYVDDMNVLSFFDYLRELVINSKRQIFFATANDDLAFLFRKKFEFLESELKDYKLERIIENV